MRLADLETKIILSRHKSSIHLYLLFQLSVPLGVVDAEVTSQIGWKMATLAAW